MILILTLDDHNGTQLAGKRQSKDRAVADRIIQMTWRTGLYLKETSRSFFSNVAQFALMTTVDNFDNLPHEAAVFLEEVPPKTLMDAAEKIYVFRWNRSYPSLVQDRVSLDEYKCTPVDVFPGHSHEKITLEVYEHYE